MTSISLLLLWRQWRSGSLRVLFGALLVAVVSVTSILIFIDRLQLLISHQAENFLAANLVIRSSNNEPEAWQTEASALGLKQASTLSFRSMAMSDAGVSLSAVKAVSDLYPLLGQLEISDAPFTPGYISTEGPNPGEAWLASRLFASLNVNLGDSIRIGEKAFTVTRVINKEPDQGFGLAMLAPRIMLHSQDVAATQVVQPGSRITYRYLYAGPAESIEQWRTWLSEHLTEHQQLLDIRQDRPPLAAALDRAENFLHLAGLLTFILSGIAIALAARQYALQQQTSVAILKTLGLGPKQILNRYLNMLLLLALASGLLGAGLGYLLQEALVFWLADDLGVTPPPPHSWVLLAGPVSALLSVFTFSLPPILHLHRVSPLLAINGSAGQRRPTDLWPYGLGLITGLGLILYYSNDLVLTAVISGSLLAAACLVLLLAYGLTLVGRWLGNQAGSFWRLGLANIRRRHWQSVLQIMVFSLTIMMLLVLGAIRSSLLEDWRGQLPENTPNHFLLNIEDYQVAEIQDWFNQQALVAQPIYPMVRGRLTQINGLDIYERLGPNQAMPPAIDRELALTWSEQLSADNNIIAGQWWDRFSNPGAWVSVEASLATELGIELNDRLGFSAGGQMFEAQVASIRTVNWDSMQPNFYMMFNRGTLDEYPRTFLTSFYLPSVQKPLLGDLIRQFPNLNLFEVDIIIEQVQGIMLQVTRALELVLVLVIAAGLFILIASVHTSLRERIKEVAILRSLGARQRLVQGAILSEFAGLGLMAGAVAAMGAQMAVFALQRELFSMPLSAYPSLWLLGPCLGMALIASVSYLSALPALRTPPIAVLRQAD